MDYYYFCWHDVDFEAFVLIIRFWLRQDWIFFPSHQKSICVLVPVFTVQLLNKLTAWLLTNKNHSSFVEGKLLF